MSPTVEPGGVRLIVLRALSDNGAAAYDHGIAAALAALTSAKSACFTVEQKVGCMLRTVNTPRVRDGYIRSAPHAPRVVNDR